MKATSTSSKEVSTPAFAWARASRRTWSLCRWVARSRSPALRTTSSAIPLRGTPATWRNTTACVSGFSGSGAIYKWEFTVDDRIVEYEIGGSLTISDSLFSVEAALEGTGLAYTFDALALSHIRAKKLKRVLGAFSPTFPGFYLYYPSRRQQPPKLKAFVDYALAHYRKR
jgi:DNA-binding transcriptional LysR family regulator